MIDALRNDDIITQFGGRFKLCALIQRRWLQLLQGARPMVDHKGLTEMEIVVKEILEGKIEMEIPEEIPDDEPAHA
jgi:DNA-directed RNA polymerase subunit omega